MKNTIKLCMFFFIAVSITLLNGCKKDEEEKEITSVTDFDGNLYGVVKIGSQTWMAENLRVTHYRNGDPIPNVTDSAGWRNLTTGAYCDYNNDPDVADIYGKLYNWYAVSDSRNIAPVGWHVATDADWTKLTTYLGGESAAGSKLKEEGTTHWMDPNSGASNQDDFTALPGGCRYLDSSFRNKGETGYWYTSTESGPSSAWHREMYYNYYDVFRLAQSKTLGFSVRCVKD